MTATVFKDKIDVLIVTALFGNESPQSWKQPKQA